MNKFKLYFIWCLIVGALVSCDKKDDASPQTEQDYLPTTAGSTWSYGGSMPYTLTATGNLQDINAKSYFEMETKQGGSTVNKSYIGKEKGVYTAIGLLPNLGTMEVMVLKEETPLGKPWEQTTVINGVDTKLTFTIQEKNVAKTISGKSFDNVIHVRLVTSFTFMGVDLGTSLNSDLYFAKGVGLILSDLGTYGQFPLLTYDVK